MTKTTTIDVAIIGAGIIGVSIAFKLQEAGRTAVLIDRKGIAEETSRGNAGAFAFSDVIPMATSGVLQKLPRWLSDPLGPLTIRPEYLLPITPWLLRFRRAEVTQLRPEADGVAIQFADGSSLQARQVVVAGGAWSKRLTAPLGDNIPLETERGYNTTLPGYSFDLKRQLVFGGHGFVVTPLESGIRIGGAVELGGLTLPPNFKRADAMLTKAATFMPGLVTTGGKQWMGFRPSLPDSLPAIGFSRQSRNIVYAFGHGHLGLTQSAGTGKLVAELLTGATPSLDLSPFSPQRF